MVSFQQLAGHVRKLSRLTLVCLLTWFQLLTLEAVAGLVCLNKKRFSIQPWLSGWDTFTHGEKSVTSSKFSQAGFSHSSQSLAQPKQPEP